MTEELEAKAAELAANALCTRCGALMVWSIGSGRATTGTHRRVGGSGVDHFNLCGPCGPAFRLFLAEVTV